MICRTGVVDLAFASAAACQITPVATAFPAAKFSRDFRAPMLPGFRFLFAATMLSMSLLIFGLGAAALLRAAHESFASNSSWHASPEVPFAQRPDTILPVLASLRVDTSPIEKANDQAAKAAAAVSQPEAAAVEPSGEQMAALKPLETPPAETAKPVELPASAPVAENPPPGETAPPAPALSVTAQTPAPSEPGVTVAAVSDAGSAINPPVKSEPTKSELTMGEPMRSEPAPQIEAAASPATVAAESAAVPLTAPADSPAATKIATLGGPPVDITDDASSIEPRAVKLPRPRPDVSAIKKRVQARRAMHRRRLALRARLLFQQQQQQVSPFAQPQQSFAPAQPRQ